MIEKKIIAKSKKQGGCKFSLLNIFKSISDSLRITETTVQLGIINKELGNFEQAEKYFKAGYDYAKRNNKAPNFA